ncbi:hypothetical protein ACIOHE_39260 [Streptomyces sp. NPDC087851]|uniref:hypothetical protein n=1 Tax=Streptomyces sp. NPDC087851 TaxID=3365810 RepID=UPI003804B1F0
MPNAPKTPARQVRIGDEWLDLGDVASSNNTDRAAIVRDLIAWYLREPGSKLPTRPTREVVLEFRRLRDEAAAAAADQ